MESQSRLEANLALERAKRESLAQQLEDWGHAFEAVPDPTPGDYAEYWNKRIALLASQIPDLKPEVPTLGLSHDQVQELTAKGRRLAVELPQIFTTDVLRVVYRQLASHWTVQPESGIDQDRIEGWFTFEDTTSAPNLRTNVPDIRRIEGETQRRLMHPLSYFTASYDHRDRTGEYFDQGETWTRLIDPREAGAVLGAYFYRLGFPDVLQDWYPADRRGSMGARFEGVK